MDPSLLERAARFGGVVPVLVKLPPERIVALKFLTESYEGLCVARTLNPETGEVVLFALPDTHRIVMELVEKLKPELGLRELALPAGADEDWLFGAAKERS
jgi:hypothetical protein